MKKSLETITRLKCSTVECRILAEIEASEDEAALSLFVVTQQAASRKAPRAHGHAAHPALAKVIEACKAMEFTE
eukprot:4825852-Pyramimonas_sp.AAC.1